MTKDSKKSINFQTDFSYPSVDDPDIQAKLFNKREFYYYNIPPRKKFTSYKEIEDYRNINCNKFSREPKEHQSIVRNIINPTTPYNGILLMYGVGSGKTMAAIQIAENFKDQIKKYNTKIHVLVPGPNTRENFKNELIDSTGNTYLKSSNDIQNQDLQTILKDRKEAINTALQYYRIMSYKTFYKKALGEKIIDRMQTKKTSGKKKIIYRKTTEGEYEREQVIDRIISLNNTLLIIDEAHNITGNEYGEAVKKIIKNSENLKIILLTATPMINYADEIIEVLNLLRPENDQIARDKIFTSDKNYLMAIKPGGLDYLMNKASGYISYYRGSVPYTFAKRIEKGIIPKGLLFTPVIKCYMNDFQYKTYLETTKKFNDSLDKASSAASNFVFPGLTSSHDNIVGFYSTEGIETVLSQLQSHGPLLCSLINTKILNNQIPKTEENLIIYKSQRGISGLILKKEYIKYFSSKIYNILNNLSKLVIDEKDPQSSSSTAFIYSNLVKAGGIEILAESLLQNGYLEYKENYSDYNINTNTLDYNTGLTYGEMVSQQKTSSFRPATFLFFASADENEELPEKKQKILKNVFNTYDNIDGKHIKFILGSRVLGEGITLKNCKEVHILDVFYNIPRTEQVIGRVIRMCVHQDVISNINKFPEVNVYKYVVSVDDREGSEALSTDEILYQKAELKYLVVKEIEYALKQTTIDCPLLYNINIFPEEVEEYKDCVPPSREALEMKKKICPALCDFKPCTFKCKSNQLNALYWDETINNYKKLEKKDLDYSTYNIDLTIAEIAAIITKLKDLYRFKSIYSYNEILTIIKSSHDSNKEKLFEELFLLKALNILCPTDDNSFNNFVDIVYDRYNNEGYLIERGDYYIFQSFNTNENVPLYFRESITLHEESNISINNYIDKLYNGDINIIKKEIIADTNMTNNYNFDDTIEYYSNRPENFIVGIFDKNFNKLASSENDLFKIRPSIKKNNDTKKRGTGIVSFLGGVCTTSKNKTILYKIIDNISKIIGKSKIISIQKKNPTKNDLCNKIKDLLLFLEKYSTSKDNNKKTYFIIPSNHPIYPFPLNLEDRAKYLCNKIMKIIKDKNFDTKISNTILENLKFTTKKLKGKDEVPFYLLSFSDSNLFNNELISEFKNLLFELKDNVWSKIIS